MLRRIFPLILALLLPAFLPLPAHADAAAVEAAAPIRKVTSVEGITEYRLANGLKVLLYPDASSDTITVSVTYLVGSRYEGYGEYGMAHLLEHMQFKGTPRHPDPKKRISGPRRALQRLDLVRPHQLLRNLRRHRCKSRLGAGTRSRPHGQFHGLRSGTSTAR